ncbi:Thiamine-phosphate synthase [Fundidesulfovibrio magnetotacticus]|uniref:Thiamine-phosphate synthase n=1 Tax=Fundidesulfovibrio magnetotacticus TaxID=2730080 RepID=A0A6V8LIX2_9BACT|nr:Thiamine-phosphate synthase [Fundidesulfovibrio magnetotacticus]
MIEAMKNFLAGGIYAILSEEHSLGRSNLEVAESILKAGVRVLQYREKNKKAGAMLEECLALRELTRAHGATFIVNDHVDLALLCHADGVHVGQEDLPPAAVRRLLGPERIVGLSTHGPSQARAAQSSGVVDYIGVGPIFATKTKKDVCDPVGLDYLRYVVEKIELPFVAIGGVKEHNIAQVRACGARMVCLVTEIVGAEDVESRVRSLAAALRA